MVLWKGNDKVTRRSTYAPYDQGGLKMLDYDNMVKALRLSWLKRIVDPDCIKKCILNWPLPIGAF